MKNIFLLNLKLYKYLFYDIIPEFYEIKWYKYEFDNKLDYYILKPIIYLIFLVISFFDISITIYRVVFILGFMKGLFKKKGSNNNE